MTRPLVLVALAAAVLLSSMPQKAPAAYAAACPSGAIVVNTTTDTVAANPAASPLDAGGNISLRSAVMFGNMDPNPHTICLGAATYALTLTGPETFFTNNPLVHDLDVSNNDLTVLGVSAASTIIRANPVPQAPTDFVNHRDQGAFTVNQVNFTLTDLTIENGFNFAFGAGVDFVTGSSSKSLSISNVVMRNNNGGVGGAVSAVSNAPGTTVTITNSTFDNNTALGHGTAVHLTTNQVVLTAALQTTITNSTFNNNRMTATDGETDEGANGGALAALWKTTTTVTNSTFTDNQAYIGGGVYLEQGTLTVTGSTISGNTARTTNIDIDAQAAGNGGGAAVTRGGHLTIINSTVSNNQAQGATNAGTCSPGCGLGGGIYATTAAATQADIPPRNTVLTVTNTTVSGNTSAGAGGGVYNGVNTTANMTGSTVSGNTAVGSGGGIWNRGAFAATNSTVSGNTVTSPTLGGGGIYSGALSSSITLTNVTLGDNVSPGTGGALSFGGGGSQASLLNTILAQGGSGSAGNCFNVAAIASQGGNISSDGTCPLTGPGDRTTTNPLLQALANNGGTTLTHMLGTGSPAIDGGTDTGCPSTDQRGRPRPLDGDTNGTVTCDSGAVEVGIDPNAAAPAVTKAFNPATVASGATTTLTITIINNTNAPRSNVSINDALPTGMTVANPATVTHNCGVGAVVSATPGSGTISLTGGSLIPNTSCTLSVNVTAAGTGTITNTTGPVSSQETGPGATASAQLTFMGATLPSSNTPTATPSPTPTPVIIIPPVIPQQVQNPAAILAVQGGIGNGTRNNTPVPARPVAVMPVITPPSTGDAGLSPQKATESR